MNDTDWKLMVQQLKGLRPKHICIGLVCMLPALYAGFTFGCWVSCTGPTGAQRIWYENPPTLAILGILAMYLYYKMTLPKETK